MPKSNKHHLELGVEFCLELAIGLYQLGAKQMDLPHNFNIGLLLWLAATVLAIRMFWIFPWIYKWPSSVKFVVAVVGIVIFGFFAWSPVQHAYYNRSGEPPTKPQQPPVQQSNKGNNNTNINGNNNTVTNKTIVIQPSDPRAKAQWDRIEKLLDAHQDETAPKNLLAKYPLGYVIFSADYSQQVFPYKRSLLSDWEFDWSVVHLTDLGDSVKIRVPDVFIQNARGRFTNTSAEIPKQVGNSYSPIAVNGVQMRVGVLGISPDGIVFIIGFRQLPS